jgi:hypothetical protein
MSQFNMIIDPAVKSAGKGPSSWIVEVKAHEGSEQLLTLPPYNDAPYAPILSTLVHEALQAIIL